MHRQNINSQHQNSVQEYSAHQYQQQSQSQPQPQQQLQQQQHHQHQQQQIAQQQRITRTEHTIRQVTQQRGQCENK